MNCRPTDHGWLIEYTDEEERLHEFIRNGFRLCGGQQGNKDREDYRKELMWLITNKPNKKEVLERAKKQTFFLGKRSADFDMFEHMSTETALRDFYAELDKFGSRGCL